MNISCVIVSYNNGALLEDAIMSVVRQTRPVDEIIVADDASADGSRQLVETLTHQYPNIKPVFRERNLGVSANRDLALREARGDFITWLDGDDYFLLTKIEAEAKAVGQRYGVIAYSDVRWIDRKRNRVRTGANADFATLGARDRVRWLLKRTRQSPAAMLVPKNTHLRIGGYRHDLRTYEDWDYVLRLATQPLRWAHSGTEGLVHHPAGGLSRQAPHEHMRDELRVLRLNQEMLSRHAGLPLLVATASRVIASRSKWWLVPKYRERRRRLARVFRPCRGPAR
jgi:glycosyltransferase involved in cell wall biosynthesis